MQYVSSNCHVFVALGKSDAEKVVDFIYLKTCRKNVFLIANLFGYILVVVMLVFNITEYFFYNIFERLASD